jgi:transposase
MKKRKIYSGSFKARVVADLLKGKKELNELADYYQLHPNQIKNWKTTLFKRAHIVLDDRRHNNNKNNNLYY